jgi:quinol monooxygenase YgiN
LADRLLEAAAQMEHAPGCLQYFIYRGEADDVWVSELWVTREDHDRSLNFPGVREFIREAMPLIADIEPTRRAILAGQPQGEDRSFGCPEVIGDTAKPAPAHMTAGRIALEDFPPVELPTGR